MIDADIVVREATREDVPALLSLLLTSFRRFPLFDYLYLPLHVDQDNAFDTIYFWDKRLRKVLLDPSAKIFVADTQDSDLPSMAPEPPLDRVDQDSWDMLKWINSKGVVSQYNRATGSTIIGFSIWEWKGKPVPNRYRWLWEFPIFNMAQEVMIDLQLWYHRTFYTRKDQDSRRYANYLSAEEELEEKYHDGTFLYLENLCVDFRAIRAGIGRLLLDKGIEEAAALNLSIKTETTENNLRFYAKSGFRSVGEWVVEGFQQSTGMRLFAVEWNKDTSSS